MDSKFPLLLILTSGIAFAGTWMFMGSGFGGHHRIEVPAKAGSAKMLTFANCSEVQAAGLAPLYAGHPGYQKELDPDGTGIACAPH